MIGALLSVFYLQSEVVQIFYDYVRFMDLTVYLSILCLLVLFKDIYNQSKLTRLIRDSFFLSIAEGAFILIKQNMGILFLLFTLCMYFYLLIVLTDYRKSIVKSFLYFLFFIISFVLTTLANVVGISNFSSFLQLTIGGATSAKGGIVPILFGWIINGKDLFKSAIPISICILSLLFIGLKYKGNKSEQFGNFKTIFFLLISFFIIIIFLLSYNVEAVATFWANRGNISPYAVYIITVFIFIFYALKILKHFLYKEIISMKMIKILVVSGSIFAIGFGCGTSGGISNGQMGIGLGFISILLLEYWNLGWNNSIIKRMIFVLLTVIFSISIITCGTFKMINTYSWWGLTDDDIWKSNHNIKIPILEHILVSEEKKVLLESIYDVITEKTKVNDSIFCFPHIPIVYTMCNREDPGTYTKVQWFDVATDNNILRDIEIIENEKPKALVIYNIPIFAVEAHEKAFRSGDISGTRKMYNSLYKFAKENNYTFYGNYKINADCSITLYVDENNSKNSNYFNGIGTKESPFLIENKQQLIDFRNAVNEGWKCEGVYFKQTNDIDLGSLDKWIPIGRFDKGNYFYGVYDGNGKIIYNLNYEADEEEYNGGFFGVLGGKVLNLGIEGYINGNCCGSITSHSIGDKAGIYNCWSNVDITAYRAGGIADNFTGDIINCVSIGKLYGQESANLVSYNINGINCKDCYINVDGIISPQICQHLYINKVLYCPLKELLTSKFINTLNNQNVNEEYNHLNLAKWDYSYMERILSH